MKRTLSLILALALTVMLVPAAAFAIEGTSITNIAGLRKVLTSGEGGIYYLTADITDMTDRPIIIAGGEYTLNLHGHIISGYGDGKNPMICVQGGSLTIEDSKTNGGITCLPDKKGSYADPVGCDSGTLIINDGIFKGAYGTWSEGGSTTINGGRFEGDRYGVIVHGGTVVINGGIFAVTAEKDGDGAAAMCLPYNASGSLTINNGKFTANGSDGAYALGVGSGTCTVRGGTFDSTGYEAVGHSGGNLKISGGAFTGAAYGLLAVELYSSLKLDISGGIFTGGMAGLMFCEENAAAKCSVTGGSFKAVDGVIGAVAVEGAGQKAADVLAAGYEFSSTKEDVIYFGDETYSATASQSVTIKENKKIRVYTPWQIFSDVDEKAWYGVEQQGVIKGVYENYLMEGKTDGSFGIGGKLTIAQALTVAARIHYLHTTGNELVAETTSPWYQFYLDYDVKNGIVTADEFAGKYNENAKRSEMAHIFVHCLPREEFTEINVVSALPDVEENGKYGDEIFMLYRSGVLTGKNTAGTFAGDTDISREEAAAIILRVYVPAERKKMADK